MLYRLATELTAPFVTPLLQRRRNRVSPIFKRTFFSPLENAGKMPPKSAIWLHCASAGEVEAAQPLIDALLTHNRACFVTLWSPNGAVKLHQLFGEQVPWSWLPWDRRATLRRWLHTLQPAELWILETELWPHLLQEAAAFGCPIRYVNGRLTEKTLKAPTFLHAAWRAGLEQIAQVLARSDADAEGFAQLGVPPERIEVAGNLKWLAAARLIDQPPEPLRATPYALFASAYPEETEALLPLLAAHRPRLPWVIVPRRPQRDADDLHAAATEQGVRAVKVTDDSHAQADADVLIETRFGTQARWMAGAQAVLMGGSFAPYGGHNFLEAAALGRAIVIGTDMRDFTAETDLFLQAQALIQRESMDEALAEMTRLLDQPDEASALGQRAKTALLTRQDVIRQRYYSALGLER